MCADNRHHVYKNRDLAWIQPTRSRPPLILLCGAVVVTTVALLPFGSRLLQSLLLGPAPSSGPPVHITVI